MSAAAMRPPNLLWLVLSQWRWDLTGAGGHPLVRTPHFDAFAGSGLRLGGAVATHPFPPQSKAAFLTGLRAERSGVAGAFSPLVRQVGTLADWLGEVGYHTVHLGKWQLGPRDGTQPLVGPAAARRPVPEEFRGGFSEWWGWDGGFMAEDPWVQGDGESEPRCVRGHQSAVLAAKAVEVLERLESPWFACVHFDAPHPPWSAEARAYSERNWRGCAVPEDVPDDRELRERVARELCAAVWDLERADAACAQVLAALSGTGASRNTLVCWFGNHGDQMGSGGLLRKGWPHPASVRVPFALRGCGLRSGQVGGAFGLVDLAPTCLGLLGFEPPAGLDGRNLAGALREMRTLGDSVEVSLPEAPGIPLQCDHAWRGALRVGAAEGGCDLEFRLEGRAGVQLWPGRSGWK